MNVDVGSEILILFILIVIFSGNGILPFLLLAAAVHEAAHFLTLRLLGGRADSFELGLGGARAVISNVHQLSYKRELCAVAAGPFASILFAIILSYAGKRLESEWMLVTAGCSLVLGLYNLLPMRFLDGGRMFHLLLLLYKSPDECEAICRMVSWIVLAVLFILSVAAARKTGLLSPLFSIALYIAANILCEFGAKRPAG